jgi:hypothetical protein
LDEEVYFSARLDVSPAGYRPDWLYLNYDTELGPDFEKFERVGTGQSGFYRSAAGALKLRLYR